MTGTAITEAEEFFDIYKLNVVSIPTNKKMQRKDINDQIFRTEPEKYNAITNKIIECNNKGQPILVGTTSVEVSELLTFSVGVFLSSRPVGLGSDLEPFALNEPKKLENVEIKLVIGEMKASIKLVIPEAVPVNPAPTS